jgi:predicted DNA binding CopG/RHH family protein
MQKETADAKIQVRLPQELVERLHVIANSRGIGLSTLVRMLLYASLERPA